MNPTRWLLVVRWISSKRLCHPSIANIRHSSIDPSIDYLIDRIWDQLHLVKVYTKKRGAHPDLSDPICLRKGATIEVSRAAALLSNIFMIKYPRMFVMEFTDP